MMILKIDQAAIQVSTGKKFNNFHESMVSL